MTASPASSVTQQQIIQQSLNACVSSGMDASSCLSMVNEVLGYIDPASPCSARIKELAGQNQLAPVILQAIQQGRGVCDILNEQGQKIPQKNTASDSMWKAIMITGLGIGLGAFFSTVFTGLWKGRK